MSAQIEQTIESHIVTENNDEPDIPVCLPTDQNIDE